MADDAQVQEAGDSDDEEYESPEIVVLGSIDELTWGGGGVGTDALEASASVMVF